MNASSDFGPFDERIWMNTAHQGPMPRVAVEAAHEALAMKIAPHRIRDELFSEVPLKLKGALAQLIGAAPQDIVLGNSATYGLHLLANGCRFQEEDEVLLVDGDFPADIFPWLALQKKGVRIRMIRPAKAVVSPEELQLAITPGTRIFCTSWVNSFNGHVIDLKGIGAVCLERGVTFVVNGSQGIGALTFDVSAFHAGAVVACGYKWLCGPYGTGFCWMCPELREMLDYNNGYWLPNLWGSDSLQSYIPRADLGSAALDIFCTANFLNFLPWNAAVNYLLSRGLHDIERHNDLLVRQLLDGPSSKYKVLSPVQGNRSSIVVVSHEDTNRNAAVYDRLTTAGVDSSLRENRLRFSLHLFNTAAEVERVLEVLNQSAET